MKQHDHPPAARLTSAEVERLRASWFELEAGDIDIAKRFYERLFEASPDVRRMFRGDMPSQNRKFMSTLALVVESIETPDRAARVVADLGQRHVNFGVEAHHYTLVGDVLLATLSDSLADEFDDVTRRAWHKAYWLLADAMEANDLM